MRYPLLGLLLLMAPLASASSVSLDDVLARVRAQNPDIQAARQAWEVARHQVVPAQTWPDPTFTYIDERFPAATPGMDAQPISHFRIEQEIPFPGKLSNEGRMKYHEALIAEETYRMKVLDTLRDARMRYYQLYLTDQKITLAAQGAEVMRTLLASAQARLASGQSSTSDVFMAQTELRRMENNLFEQRQQRALISVELNTLLAQPTDTLWGELAAPELKDPPMTLVEAMAMAKAHAPNYLAALHETHHAQAMMLRNRLEYAPDFGIMYEYEKSGPESGRQIGVSVKFPLWLQRPWSDVRAAQAHLLETQANAEAMQNEILRRVHTEYLQTQTQLKLTRNDLAGILPASQAALRVARQQYASGQGDIVRLLAAYRAWLDAHNDYQEHLYGVAEHVSRLEAWMGFGLNDTPTEKPHAH